MSKVIEINNISKVYELGLVGTGTLSKDLNRSLAKLLGKPDPYATLVELNDRTKKSSSNMVYALKDINFSVDQGEVLGIIGKNGVEQIVDVQLNAAEQQKFSQSAQAVRNMNAALKDLL